MENELDIVSFLKSLRISEFIHQTHLTEYQRYFVNKFRNYHLSHDEKTNDHLKERCNIEDLLVESGFDDSTYDKNKVEKMTNQLSIESDIDRRIIFEVIGVKANSADKYGVLDDT
jgi:hypothetical protein